MGLTVEEAFQTLHMEAQYHHSKTHSLADQLELMEVYLQQSTTSIS